MEKINLPFFYQLGGKLGPLAQMNADTTTVADIYLAAFFARMQVETLLEKFPTLTVCVAAGRALLATVDEIQKLVCTPESQPKWNEPPPAVQKFRFSNVIGKAKESRLCYRPNSTP